MCRLFVKSVLIEAPVRDVFGFHERADALTLLSPPFPPVRVISRVGGIKTGAQVVLKVGLVRWIARHIAYEKDRLFVDEQIRGPFRSWVHRHEFEAVDGKTRLTDRIEYQLHGGPLANLLFGSIINMVLGNMFRYRHRVIREFCEQR
jgi:ligand-binding SRPBCC domain-containing protein